MTNTTRVLPEYSKVFHPVTNEAFLQPMCVNQELFTSAITYQAKPNDVFLAAYTKCGATWLQNIIWLVVHNGEEISDNTTLRDWIPMLEFDSPKNWDHKRTPSSPKLIKTHLSFECVPYSDQSKYIFITRNPKDAVVSYYYHVLGFAADYNAVGLKFNDLFDIYTKGDVDWGSFFDHGVSWFENKNKPNVLFLLFEDLKSDIRGNILKIAQFLGKKYENALLKNDETLLKVVIEKSTFNSMKKNVKKWCQAERPDNLPFIRKGEVGDWRNHLSTGQSETIDRILKEKGQKSGFDKLWDNHQGALQ